VAPLVLALSLAGMSACSSGDGEPGTTDESQVDQTLADIVGDTADLSAVTTALDDTGLEGVLDGPASYTFFAPTDKAFEALGKDGERLTGDGQEALLAAVLRDHLVPGALTPDAIREAIKQAGGKVTMRTLGTGALSFTEEGDSLVVSGPDGTKAHIAGTSRVANNGVLIPLDGLLVKLPEAN